MQINYLVLIDMNAYVDSLNLIYVLQILPSAKVDCVNSVVPVP